MDKEDLNQKILILKKYLEEGRIKFVKNLKVIESLQKVKYGPDGMVNPDTVDGLVRSLANTASFINYREELKKIPLIDVMKKYYEILDLYFGVPYQQMVKNKVTPYQIASSIASNKKIVNAFSIDAENFEKEIKEFWETFFPVIEAHIEDMQTLKTVYGGDIFPNYDKNIISNTGLYIDTIILPDPILRCVSFFKFFTPEKAVFFITKHALSVLALKDIVLAKVNPPIAIIVPDSFHLDENTKRYIQSVGEKDLLTHMGIAFGKEFKNDSELNIFLEKINSLTKLESLLKKKDRILFDVDWSNLSLEDQWKKMQKDFIDYSRVNLSKENIGQQLKFSLSGRMMQINDIIFKSSKLRGIPLIDAPTSWKYFLWKYEYDKKISNEINPDLKNLLIVSALQSEKLGWLGNIPLKNLIKLRKEGALNDFRSIISKGIETVSNANESSYKETLQNVVENLNNAIKVHQNELKESSGKTKKFFGFDISPWLITGSISIAAASTGNIPLSIISAAAGMVGCSSARELWSKGKDILENKTKIKRSPVGILFKAKKNK